MAMEPSTGTMPRHFLDYASGSREEISSLDYADLDGSGAVTTYDAYLLLEGLNGGTVTLPAGGKTDIIVTMTLTKAQKKALDEKYESGAYVQGYVFAAPTATSEGRLVYPDLETAPTDLAYNPADGYLYGISGRTAWYA